mmetsp:Transcript_15279/g.35786  ORF Transcript_15279/g.35786 Transcript_15279/m.35786 type:complete len:87 (-) Transcript_15279:168-428(-)
MEQMKCPWLSMGVSQEIVITLLPGSTPPLSEDAAERLGRGHVLKKHTGFVYRGLDNSAASILTPCADAPIPGSKLELAAQSPPTGV